MFVCLFGQGMEGGGGEGGKSGPMRRTRLRLRDWVRVLVVSELIKGGKFIGMGH